MAGEAAGTAPAKKTRAPKQTLAERFKSQIAEEVDKYERAKEKLDKQKAGIERMKEALKIMEDTTPSATPKKK